ncbi:hypothetical protein DQ04_01121010 [Trypanosoma grayi]|uniref:hypothetical protein n=1 Tax=Trypanosoma grayi TaxID=71804 RepID=UPI0004F40096|nr:hypothetical protein DQ04_01121010 [Trypanosoma grayi]KEG13246.1 hypothetical protein DQ04_01121010 [Trypanosoma grayi]
MDIQKETESVLAIADDVIASIGTNSLVSGTELYQSFEGRKVSKSCKNGVDKSVQTQTYSLHKSTQHCESKKNVAIQNAPLSFHRSTETESFGFSTATQTEPDILPDIIRVSFQKTSNMVSIANLKMEELWLGLQNRFNRCSSELQRLATFVKSLRRSRDALEVNLRNAHMVMEITSLVQLELEARFVIWAEERDSRNDISFTAYRNMIGFLREIEADFFVARSELVEKLDDIDALQRELSDRKEKNVMISANGTDLACDSVSGKLQSENEDDGVSLKEMKKLLTECWVVLGQDA